MPDKKPVPGETVVLTKIPPGLLDDLPIEDRNAISEVVGKPIALNEYDEDGRAELEFRDSDGIKHFVWVNPRFIRSAG